MQKVEIYYKPDSSDKDRINNELKDGWLIKSMVGVESKLIVVYEKNSRKEKLDALNDLQNDKV